ncbi:MAG: hypothetical protein EWM45_11940 [Rhodopseudomonas palustris]|nr:MAG: hypothetical protein EWM45_11940 [Rhodopseudomonas palustris]
MGEPAENLGFDRYEQAVDQAIATFGGDPRGALKALIIANEYLEAELQAVYAAVSTGYARGRVLKVRAPEAKAVEDG